MEMTVEVADLVELCRHRAELLPDERAFVFLDSGVIESDVLTYAKLDERARGVAVWLRDRVPPRGRVVLSYPPGLDFVAAFFGCLYAGVVAVPAPHVRRAGRLQDIVADCRPDLILSTVETGDPELWTAPHLYPDDIAYLQYTSGTTGRAKGVVLTHRNVLQNLSLIVASGSRPDESQRRMPPTVTWLPVFHDMGLISGVLQPLFLGHESVLMSAQSFARVPANWLRAISRYGAEIAAAPSLGYEMCLRRVRDDQVASLDLSRWRIAAISDEPLRADTIDAFSARFGPSGFRRSAFFPCYGMAESTVLVSGGPVEAEPVIREFDAASLAAGRVVLARNGFPSVRLVGCGEPDPTLALAFDADPGEVGELLVSGPSIGSGYWDATELTELTFGVTVPGHGDRRFLRTGNLGFLFEGQLFVTCRVADLLVVEGKQFYPYDIEAAATDSHPAIRQTCAIFDDGVVVLAEIDRKFQDTPAAEIEDAVRVAAGVEIARVVLLKPGALLFTTSGKLRRADCRSTLLGGN